MGKDLRFPLVLVCVPCRCDRSLADLQDLHPVLSRSPRPNHLHQSLRCHQKERHLSHPRQPPPFLRPTARQLSPALLHHKECQSSHHEGCFRCYRPHRLWNRRRDGVIKKICNCIKEKNDGIISCDKSNTSQTNKKQKKDIEGCCLNATKSTKL